MLSSKKRFPRLLILFSFSSPLMAQTETPTESPSEVVTPEIAPNSQATPSVVPTPLESIPQAEPSVPPPTDSPPPAQNQAPVPEEEAIQAAFERVDKIKAQMQKITDLEINHALLLPRIMAAQKNHATLPTEETRAQWAELLNADALITIALIEAWKDLDWMRQKADAARRTLESSYTADASPFQDPQNAMYKVLLDQSDLHTTDTTNHLETAHELEDTTFTETILTRATTVSVTPLEAPKGVKKSPMKKIKKEAQKVKKPLKKKATQKKVQKPAVVLQKKETSWVEKVKGFFGGQ